MAIRTRSRSTGTVATHDSSDPAAAAPLSRVRPALRAVGGSNSSRSSPKALQKSGKKPRSGRKARAPKMPADEWQIVIMSEYRMRENAAHLLNFYARTDDELVHPLPIVPTLETHTVQDWSDFDKLLPVPAGLRGRASRGELLAMPIIQIGKSLKDYGLELPLDQGMWIDVLLRHLGAPDRAAVAAYHNEG